MPIPKIEITTKLDKLTQRPRNTNSPILLIGFLDQGNLGLGYLSSTLKRYHYRVIILDIESDPKEILKIAKKEKPILIGFSMIFQFYINKYDYLLNYLKQNGVSCHFVMGGHFPSLSYEQTLHNLPSLDSIVRFEGELTLLHLADTISTGRCWHHIPGIAYRDNVENKKYIVNPPDVYLHDLDWLPYPERNFEAESVLGCKAMPLLASRGCARTCSFCSIHTFYRAAPGKVVRTRNPAKIVEEMRYLVDEHDISIFLFQDDDFPLFGPVWQKWARNFIKELHRAELPGRCVWKMNCRADAVDYDLFKQMKQAGLYLVYMGLESGSEEGLKTLNKGITVEQNLNAVSILQKLGLIFEFGFMMFDPSSTFNSVRENIHFLKTITNDGKVAAVFCRMLPYDGTPIKTDLENSGRLKGDITKPDYNFLDKSLDEYYEELSNIIHITGWIHGHRALSPQLNWAWNEIAIMNHLFPVLPGLSKYTKNLARLTHDSNQLLFQIVEDLADQYTNKKLKHLSVQQSKKQLRRRTEEYLDNLIEIRNQFVIKNQNLLLQTHKTKSLRATG